MISTPASATLESRLDAADARRAPTPTREAQVILWLMRTGLAVAANAVGLIVAATILDQMGLEPSGFIIAVLIFTGVQMLMRPALTSFALKYQPAFAGSSAVLAALVALIVTTIVSDGLTIDGFGTWVAATVIVWLISLVGAVVLPMIFLKNRIEENRAAR